ncbi:MAG: dihydroneopterin aldolase [Bacteroides sp.]
MKTTSSYIFLENVRFYAYHGVAPQETVVGNEFIINLKLKVDFSRATTTDEVTDTVSYAEVYEVVRKEMLQPSKLLEHVCGRIVRRLFDTFPGIDDIAIKLAKRHPPIRADLDAAGVEMYCENNRTPFT